MGEEELADLPQVVHDIVDVVPVEAFPVGPLPVQAVDWFPRLLLFFSQHAYLLTFSGALIENTIILGFLLPGGTVVALAGAGGRAADLSLPVLVLLAAAGMCGGAMIDYYLGRAGIGRVLHHPWAGRWGRMLAAQLEQAEPLLRRHGWWMMLVAHAFGTGRSSLAVAAGASGLPLWRFMAIEAPAALLWASLYAGGGYFLASQWGTFELLLRRMGWGATLLMIGMAALWWLWHRRRSKGGPETVNAPARAATALAPEAQEALRELVPSPAPAPPLEQLR